MGTVQQLLDRAAIQELVVRCADASDNEDLATMAACFVAGAHYEGGLSSGTVEHFLAAFSDARSQAPGRAHGARAGFSRIGHEPGGGHRSRRPLAAPRPDPSRRVPQVDRRLRLHEDDRSIPADSVVPVRRGTQGLGAPELRKAPRIGRAARSRREAPGLILAEREPFIPYANLGHLSGPPRERLDAALRASTRNRRDLPGDDERDTESSELDAASKAQGQAPRDPRHDQYHTRSCWKRRLARRDLAPRGPGNRGFDRHRWLRVGCEHVAT